jgi:hypothetical protein
MVKVGASDKKFLMNPHLGELLACLAGVRMAASMGLSRVILEIDATMVKAVVEGDKYRLSAWGWNNYRTLALAYVRV